MKESRRHNAIKIKSSSVVMVDNWNQICTLLLYRIFSPEMDVRRSEHKLFYSKKHNTLFSFWIRIRIIWKVEFTCYLFCCCLQLLSYISYIPMHFFMLPAYKKKILIVLWCREVRVFLSVIFKIESILIWWIFFLQ